MRNCGTPVESKRKPSGGTTMSRQAERIERAAAILRQPELGQASRDGETVDICMPTGVVIMTKSFGDLVAAFDDRPGIQAELRRMNAEQRQEALQAFKTGLEERAAEGAGAERARCLGIIDVAQNAGLPLNSDQLRAWILDPEMTAGKAAEMILRGRIRDDFTSRLLSP